MYFGNRLLRGNICATVLALFCVGAPAWSSAQVAPPLGQAASFSVLAGSTVTNTGPTVVLGDLGVSPGLAVVGFPPGLVSGGTIHAGGAVAQGAEDDVTTAYNQLAGQASNVTLTGQDLGGLTLTSGVYTFSSAAQLTGTLTLDAQGDPAAVFVFQIGSTLTTASGSRVVVINGGTDCNVFWQVGSSATLGTTTSFVGNILALTSITLNTGVRLSGRALARNGAVTLDSNDVTICGLCTAITLSPSTLPAVASGVPFLQAILATGGTAPYAFTLSSGALPAGVTLASDGTLSGTPSVVGTFTFTVHATDAVGCPADVTYTLVVNPVACSATITVAPATLPSGVVGAIGTQTLTASGGAGPYSFALASGSLPAGMTLSSAGVLSGTPASAGAFSFTVVATDSAGCSGTQRYTLAIAPAVCSAIALAPSTLPGLAVDRPFAQSFTASGGSAPYAFELAGGALPDGLALTTTSADTALVSGTPTRSQSYTFTLQATDGSGCTTSQTYTGVVDAGTVATPAPAMSIWSSLLLLAFVSIASLAAFRRT